MCIYISLSPSLPFSFSLSGVCVRVYTSVGVLKFFLTWSYRQVRAPGMLAGKEAQALCFGSQSCLSRQAFPCTAVDTHRKVPTGSFLSAWCVILNSAKQVKGAMINPNRGSILKSKALGTACYALLGEPGSS